MGPIDFTGAFIGLFAIGLIVGGVFAIPAALVADNSCDRYWKKEAMEAGYAEYYLDENNERQWRWKEHDE